MIIFFSFNFAIKMSDSIRYANTKMQKIYYYSSLNGNFKKPSNNWTYET